MGTDDDSSDNSRDNSEKGSQRSEKGSKRSQSARDPNLNTKDLEKSERNKGNDSKKEGELSKIKDDSKKEGSNMEKSKKVKEDKQANPAKSPINARTTRRIIFVILCFIKLIMFLTLIVPVSYLNSEKINAIVEWAAEFRADWQGFPNTKHPYAKFNTFFAMIVFMIIGIIVQLMGMSVILWPKNRMTAFLFLVGVVDFAIASFAFTSLTIAVIGQLEISAHSVNLESSKEIKGFSVLISLLVIFYTQANHRHSVWTEIMSGEEPKMIVDEGRVMKLMDILHKDFECCGFYSPEDWWKTDTNVLVLEPMNLMDVMIGPVYRQLPNDIFIRYCTSDLAQKRGKKRDENIPLNATLCFVPPSCCKTTGDPNCHLANYNLAYIKENYNRGENENDVSISPTSGDDVLKTKVTATSLDNSRNQSKTDNKSDTTSNAMPATYLETIKNQLVESEMREDNEIPCDEEENSAVRDYLNEERHYIFAQKARKIMRADEIASLNPNGIHSQGCIRAFLDVGSWYLTLIILMSLVTILLTFPSALLSTYVYSQIPPNL